MNPFFSIIIPTFQAESTIYSCLNSIISQSYKNFEVLVIDGMSSDRTVALAKSYKDSRVRIVSQVDKGIYDAMNRGIGLSTGDWLYFLGSDDRLNAADVLEQVSRNIIDADVIYGNVYRNIAHDIYDGEFCRRKILEKNICHQSIFFRAAVFKKIGLYNIRYKTYADWDHNLRWFFNRKIRKRFLEIVIANYNQTGFSTNRTDALFSAMKEWKYFMLIRKEIKLCDKISIAKREFSRAIKGRRRRDAITILYQIPLFII